MKHQRIQPVSNKFAFRFTDQKAHNGTFVESSSSIFKLGVASDQTDTALNARFVEVVQAGDLSGLKQGDIVVVENLMWTLPIDLDGTPLNMSDSCKVIAVLKDGVLEAYTGFVQVYEHSRISYHGTFRITGNRRIDHCGTDAKVMCQNSSNPDDIVVLDHERCVHTCKYLGQTYYFVNKKDIYATNVGSQWAVSEGKLLFNYVDEISTEGTFVDKTESGFVLAVDTSQPMSYHKPRVIDVISRGSDRNTEERAIIEHPNKSIRVNAKGTHVFLIDEINVLAYLKS